MKYTSIAKIFNFLPKNLSEDDAYVIEYASQAMDMLNIHEVYDKKVCLIYVTDHQAYLPKDLKFIQALTYMHSQPTQTEADDVITSYSKTVEDLGDTIMTTKSSMTTEPDPGIWNQSHILRIQHQGVLNNYQLWSESNLFNNNFSLLRLVNKSVNINMHCNDCPNLHCDSQDYYQVNMQGQIITSIKEGYLCLFYLAKQKNERGEFLIPDDPDVLTALAAYVKYKVVEDLAFTRQKGYAQMYERELQRWEQLAAKVKGKYIMKSVNFKDLETYGNQLSNVFHNSRAFDNFSY